MRPLLVLLALLALPAAAQPAPVVANAPVADGALAHLGGEPIPDTTAPWRYYPLELGNVWEYEDSRGVLRRRSIERDTFALGHRYFIEQMRFRAPPGAASSVYEQILRFDTTTATLRSLSRGDPPTETAYCPFDAPFDAIVICDPEGPHEVTGTYEGVLVFGGVSPGTGTDTVRTALKQYEATGTGFLVRYGANVGIVYEAGDFFFNALTYYLSRRGGGARRAAIPRCCRACAGDAGDSRAGGVAEPVARPVDRIGGVVKSSREGRPRRLQRDRPPHPPGPVRGRRVGRA